MRTMQKYLHKKCYKIEIIFTVFEIKAIAFCDILTLK